MSKFLSNEEKGHAIRNIKLVLQHRFRFKLYIKFKASAAYGETIKGFTFYGNEHKCTYNQCLTGKIPTIILDQKQGYQELIRQIEKEWKGQHSVERYPDLYIG